MSTTKSLQPLIELFCSISSPVMMEEMLKAMLTEKELDDVRNRLQIVQLLSQKVTQREISARLGVGIATVSRGANALKSGKFDVLSLS